MIKHHEQKLCGEKRVYFILDFQETLSLREVGVGTQDKSLEAGTETELVEECLLLSCSYGFPSLLSYTTQNYHSHSGLRPSTSINNQENDSEHMKLEEKRCVGG